MKQLNKNQYYINGWIFDFKRMMALGMGLHRHRIVDFIIRDNSIFITSGYTNIRPGFFSEPEDTYNNVIINAYNSFLIETMLLEDNNE